MQSSSEEWQRAQDVLWDMELDAVCTGAECDGWGDEVAREGCERERDVRDGL